MPCFAGFGVILSFSAEFLFFWKDEGSLYELLVMNHIQFVFYPGLQGFGGFGDVLAFVWAVLGQRILVQR